MENILTLYDSDGNITKGDKNKSVFGPKLLEKGQYGIFTIQAEDSTDSAKIEVEGIW